MATGQALCVTPLDLATQPALDYVLWLLPYTQGQYWEKHLDKDLYHLTPRCQSHKHSKTCYKYWKGPPDVKECCPNLNETNFCSVSSVDVETGEICLRCLDGMVNNFNATIFQAICCNMVIKFIGSGPSAKAVLYYITDYVTKSQLKTHVTFAALQLAVHKLAEFNPNEDELTIRTKKLLQKCAHVMISHQELSAQMVCTYLMDYEYHFSSHYYQNLYWTAIEFYINCQDPSPKCYETKRDSHTSTDHPCMTNQAEDENLSHQIHSDISENDDEDDEEQDIPSITVDEDEVMITPDNKGGIAVCSSQMMDYCLCSKSFQNLTLWDFVTQMEKVKTTRKKKLSEDQLDTDSENSDDETNEDDSYNMNNDIPLTVTQIDHLLHSSRRLQPVCTLQALHPESETHFLRMRTPNQRFVTVPIGPKIPCHDRTDVYAKYCRLMLLFFKPWHSSTDLCLPGQTWMDAFNIFMTDCPPQFKNIINNMQLLHECKDCCDDPFKNR
jgi:hypothetical protein